LSNNHATFKKERVTRRGREREIKFSNHEFENSDYFY
jgi:hypothetical protein